MTDEQHDQVAHGPGKRTWFDDDNSVYLILGLVFLVIGISGLANDSAQWTFLPIGIVFMAISATSSRKKTDSRGGGDGGPAVGGRGSDHDVDGGGSDGSGGGDGGGGGGD